MADWVQCRFKASIGNSFVWGAICPLIAYPLDPSCMFCDCCGNCCHWTKEKRASMYDYAERIRTVGIPRNTRDDVIVAVHRIGASVPQQQQQQLQQQQVQQQHWQQQQQQVQQQHWQQQQYQPQAAPQAVIA